MNAGQLQASWWENSCTYMYTYIVRSALNRAITWFSLEVWKFFRQVVWIKPYLIAAFLIFGL